MLVKPNLNYKLLGTDIVLNKDKVYDADHATNQPDWKERGAIFCGQVLLEKGEYEIWPTLQPNKELRPAFDYSCECGYSVCSVCGYPCYPMELEPDSRGVTLCEECYQGDMIEYKAKS